MLWIFILLVVCFLYFWATEDKKQNSDGSRKAHPTEKTDEEDDLFNTDLGDFDDTFK
jgi:hypothetical protein